MAQAKKNLPAKQPRRPHYIIQWAEKSGLTQAALARAIGADKGLVSRWYRGGSPIDKWQKRLSDYFEIPPSALFADPNDDWLREFLANRTAEEILRIRATLEMAFPTKPVSKVAPDKKERRGSAEK